MTLQFFFSKKIPAQRRLFVFARDICRRTAKIPRRGEICLAFVSDRKIAKINQSFFKKNLPTDVIAFPYFSHGSRVTSHEPRATSHDDFQPFGDIYISVDTARRQARKGGHSLLQELALLICHGLLHLSGFEDTSPAKKKKMFQMQKKIFLDLAPDLAPPDILK